LTALAAVVLVHADPAHFGRLTRALAGIPLVVHCDARTAAPVYRQLRGAATGQVRFIERRRTSLASWSLVQAELDALRAALTWTNAEHIAVLSGADYPLTNTQNLLTALRDRVGRSWIQNQPLPAPEWNTPRHRDGGLWRLRYRYLVRGGQIVFWRGHPLRWPIPRQLPGGLALRGASQWKIYSREHARGLLAAADSRPDLMGFWRSTLVPDETFAASMLATPALFGSDALTPCRTSAWYIDWEDNDTGHPRWLDESYYDRLEALRSAPVGPDRKLFARKFRSADSAVVDLIDARLRVDHVPPVTPGG